MASAADEASASFEYGDTRLIGFKGSVTVPEQLQLGLLAAITANFV